MHNAEQQLDAIRTAIDAIDWQLQTLINQRAELALKIGHIKRQAEDPISHYCPARETAILAHITARQSGPLGAEQLCAIFQPLLTACRNLQETVRVGFLGPAGTFSHLAAFQHFSNTAIFIPLDSIAAVFRETAQKQLSYGVVPVENSTTGPIPETAVKLADSALHICGEITLPITSSLLSQQANLSAIKTLYAHAQVFLQSEQWLAQHLPDAEKITVASSAVAAQRAQQEKEAAAIASPFAAQQYTLQIVAENIADQADNATKFIILTGV